jgi:hypothetical protein
VSVTCRISPPRGTAGIVAIVSFFQLPKAGPGTKPEPIPEGAQAVSGLDGAYQQGNNDMLSVTWLRDDWLMTVILHRTDGLGQDAEDTGDRYPSRESLAPAAAKLLRSLHAGLVSSSAAPTRPPR